MPRVNNSRADVTTAVDDDHNGPAHLVLLGLVARRYYLEGRSKVDLASELGLSRFKIARLIDEAREHGVVRIEIVDLDLDIDIDLSVRLRKELHLNHALVLSPSSGPVRERLGSVAARLLAEILTEDDVLGLPWSRTVAAMAAQLHQVPPISVVQLCGSLAPGDDDLGSLDDRSPIEMVVQVARRAGSIGLVFFAPLLVSDAATARALRREPQVCRALQRADDVTTAAVGIGSWSQGQSTIFDAADPDVRREVAEQGVIGEISGVFLDKDGRVLTPPLSERIMALNGEQLNAIPEVIALAAGAPKAAVVEAAAWSGVISGVVCDTALAHASLAARVTSRP